MPDRLSDILIRGLLPPSLAPFLKFIADTFGAVVSMASANPANTLREPTIVSATIWQGCAAIFLPSTDTIISFDLCFRRLSGMVILAVYVLCGG